MEALSFNPEIERPPIGKELIKEKLSQLENQYEQETHKILQLFEFSNEGVFVANIEGEILKVNKRLVLSFEFQEKEELVGLNLMKLYSKTSYSNLLDDMVELFEHGLISYRKRVVINNLGQEFLVNIRMNLLTDSFNKTVGILGILKPASDIEDIFEDAKLNDNDLKLIFNQIPSLIFLLDNNTNILNINDTALKISKRFKEDSLGLGIGNVLRCLNSIDSVSGCGFGEKCGSCVIRNAIQDTLKNKKTHVKIESPFHKEVDGQTVELTVLVSTVFLGGKPEPAVLVTIDDISERKKIENELKQKEEELQKNNMYLKKINSRLFQSFKDIQKYNNQLRKAKDKAEEYDNLKTAFLANISHEIRTPLNGIIGFSELLTRTNLEEEQKIEYTEVIKESSSRLLSIVNDLMEISQIESGNVDVNRSDFSINELFTELQELFLSEIRAKNLRLRVNSINSIEQNSIVSDREKVLRTFCHLISNALKFTSEGYIDIGATMDGDKICFYVKDTGKGISGKTQDVIFERFRKGDDEFSRFETGIGVGLSLSKSYVDLLGGEIWLESEEDQGTVFYFSLPRAEGEVKESETDKSSDIDYSETNWEEKTILIVEDEEYNYIYLKEILRPTKAYMIHSISSELAIEVCKMIKNIDLILLDIKLPGESGYKVAEFVRANNLNIRIVAQTAYAADSDRLTALNNGCDDYLAKPIEPNVLLDKLRAYLNIS